MTFGNVADVDDRQALHISADGVLHAADPSDSLPPDERALLDRRRTATRATFLRLTLGAFVLIALVCLGIAHPYASSARFEPGSCLKYWNDPINGRTRRRFNLQAAVVSGTPRQRMWLGHVVGTCYLAYVEPSGEGVLWMRSGLNWIRQTVPPVAGEYKIASIGVDRPDVLAHIVPGGDLADHPLMGTLSVLGGSASSRVP